MSLEQHNAPATGPHLPDAALSAQADTATVATPDTFENELYGSFWIGETELALPVSAIQEVVNEPKSYSPVPLAAKHLSGLFNLRGMIIPVIDLRVLLEYPEREETGNRKVAIIENGNLCVGLLFDDTGGIIHSDMGSRVVFQGDTQNPSEVVIDGVVKLDGGARMVQILDPYKLLQIKRLPRVSAARGEHQEKSHLGARVNFISFQLGHTNCAIDLRYVQEITDMPELQTSQLAHGHLIGNVNLRGHTMPVIDFRGFIGNEPPYPFTNKEALRRRKLLVLKLPEGLVGLLVYKIDSIITSFEGDILPFANVALPRHDIVSGCLINDSNDIVILLDHVALKADKNLVAAARSCQEIYPSKPQEAEVEIADKGSAIKETYIVFSVHVQLALDVSCVNEVISRPDSLLKPPYALSFVEGILNLRGELITVIDPRKLYNLPSSTAANPKILVFHHANKKYGIVVDSADEIINKNGGQFVPMPSVSGTDITRTVSKDVLGCLSIPSRSPANGPVMVLNLEALLARCVDADGGDMDADQPDTKEVAAPRQQADSPAVTPDAHATK